MCIHVLMVSKACLVGIYQTKLEEIARCEDIKLTVIVPPSWRDPAGTIALERAHLNGYTLLVEPLRFNGHFHIHYYPSLAARLTALQPDILHMDEEPYNLATWMGIRAADRRGIKSLFFSWQNILNRYPLPFRWLERDVLRRVDFALMGNRAAVDVWRQKGYSGPCAVVPQFGVPDELFQPRPLLPQKGGPPRPLTIGSASRRLVPEKGVDLLLAAAAALDGEWRLRIAGEGPERAELKSQAVRLGIPDRVEFTGAMASADMPAFLSSLDVLVLPSRTLPNWKEQFGRVLVEAMASGVVVVGSDSGEIPNVIGPAGLIFPEGDSAALRCALEELQGSRSRMAALQQAGYARVRRLYTQKQIAAQTVAVYRQMMDAA